MRAQKVKVIFILGLCLFSKLVFAKITEKEFDDIIKAVAQIYRPIIEKNKDTLIIEKAWDDDSVNAYASKKENQRKVTFLGGYAKLDKMTKDSFAHAVCHEFGHHLGGHPYQKGKLSWGSSEGQSDYWASNICLPRLFKDDNNTQIIQGLELPLELNEKCSKFYTIEEDISKCIRISYSALINRKETYKVIKRKSEHFKEKKPLLDMKEQTVAYKTTTKYPSEQCRLDTLLAGAFCSKEFNCTRKNDSALASRPICWFRPKTLKYLSIKEEQRDTLYNFPNYLMSNNTLKIQEAIENDQFNINIKNSKGKDALYLASYNGMLSNVKFILEFDDLLLNQTDFMGQSALFVSIGKKHFEIAKLLLNQTNIDLEIENIAGTSILDIIWRSGNNTLKDIYFSKKKAIPYNIFGQRVED